MAETVLDRRANLTAPMATGFPKILSQTKPLTPVPEGSVFASVLKQTNNVASVLNMLGNQGPLFTGEDTPDFDPLPYVPAQYFQFADKYAGLTNLGQVNAMTNLIRNEQNDKARIAAYPWRSAAYGVVAGIADFPGLLMPGGVLYAEYKMGTSIARSALSVGAASFAAAAVDEAILYNSQYTRTVDESINNVAMRTMIGSALGGLGGYFAGRYAQNLTKAAVKEASDIYANGQPTFKMLEYKDGVFVATTKDLPSPAPTSTPPVGKTALIEGEAWRTSGAGSAEVPTNLNNDLPSGSFPRVESNPKSESVFTTPDPNLNPFYTKEVFDESEKISGVPKILRNAVQTSPYVALKVSPLNSANFIGDMLFDSPTGTVATDIKGIAKPANLQGLIYSNYWKFNSHYIDIQDIFFKQKDLTSTQFATELSYYIRNPGVTSANKDIARAVEIAVNKIQDPMRQWAVSLDKLDEWQEIEGYMMRIWNKDYIIENQDGLSKIFYTYYKEVNEALREALPRINALTKMISTIESQLAGANDAMKASLEAQLKQFNQMLDSIQKQEIFGTYANHFLHDDGTLRSVMSDADLIANANKTLLNVMSYGDDALEAGMLTSMLPKTSKPLKHRKILINDNYLGNFIKKDGFEILSKYIKAMNPILTTTEYAKSFGKNNLEEVLEMFKKTARDEYIATSMGMEKKAARKLERNLKKVLRDIDDSAEIILGVYGSGRNSDEWYVTFLKNFRKFNTLRMMGSMALSSLTDVGTMSIRHGPIEVLYNGILPLLKSKELRALSKESLNAIGFALDHQLGQLIKSAADTGDLEVQPNKFSGILDRMLQGFGNLTLMNQWSNAMEMMAGTLSTNSILGSIETAVAGGKVSPRDSKWLNRLGISKEHYQPIYDMWQESGGTLNGTRYSNHQHWRIDDIDIAVSLKRAAAFNAFRMALTRDIRHTLVRPGPETMPKMMHHEAGKVFGQFKIYYFAATEKVMMSSIQDIKEMQTITGLMVLLSIGMLQYVITSYTNDREPDLSPLNLAKEAADRTGIFGIFSEFFNIIGKVIPGFGTTRYLTRGISGALGGPTVSGIDDIATTLGKIYQSVSEGRTLTTKDYSVMLRLMPYQNLFYTRRLFRHLLGIEENANRPSIEVPRFTRNDSKFNPVDINEERKR